MAVRISDTTPRIILENDGIWYIEHDPGNVCKHTSLALYNLWVQSQIETWIVESIRAGGKDPFKRSEQNRHATMRLRDLLRRYKESPGIDGLTREAMCPSAAPSRAKTPAIDAGSPVSGTVFIDPTLTGRTAFVPPPEEGASMDMTPSEKAYADALERQRQAELEKQLMMEEQLKKIEAEKKRNTMILYGGIGAVVLGAGLVAYNMLKPKKKRRRR